MYQGKDWRWSMDAVRGAPHSDLGAGVGAGKRLQEEVLKEVGSCEVDGS